MSDPGTTAKDVQIVLYRWAGTWGPFKVNIPCGECSLTLDVIIDTFETELAAFRGARCPRMAERMVEAVAQARLARAHRHG